ncbi:FeoA family protein [uncultured Cohaesibacter sp.]|uniref:FeoA family protein n=1 Tax=uncultured Cohaesibacter sp. TaxID=1002546 RepID=UPI0029C6219B|nr:FeoA family protein [uncultured Cohaesibacter sp.]
MSATLSEMNVGDHGRIVRLEIGNQSYKQQLLAMGLTRGAEFTIMRVAPFGDPVEIKVRGYALSLRRSDALGVQIEACAS